MNIGIIIGLIKALAPGVDPDVIEQAVSDWLDDHPEATTTVQDGSITEAKLAQDVLAYLAEIDTLSSAITRMDEAAFAEKTVTETVTTRTELKDTVTWEDGYVTNGTAYPTSTTYKHTTIEVVPTDEISVWDGADEVAVRFADQMNGTTVVNAGSNEKPCVIQTGVTSVVISVQTTYINKDNFHLKKKHTETITETVYGLDTDDAPQADSTKPVTSKGIYTAVKNGIHSIPCIIERGSTFPIVMDAMNTVKRGAKLSASVSFTAFTSLQIGMQRANGNVDYAITVDGTNLTYNYGSNGSASSAHGLTIANNVQINVTEDTHGKINILLTSNGSTFSKSWDFVQSIISKPFLNFIGTGGEASFSFCPEDIGKDVWIFGDSYLSYSTARWMYYYMESDYADNAMICGRSGSPSEEGIASLQTLLPLGNPKYILWCFGMNDGGDSGSAPDESWKECLDSMLAMCTANGITPILATIPTVPSVNNEKKNAIVRESGYQYVDFAKAVGAQSDGTWYSGMLYTDNVHPTAEGAKALYAQALTDCPQLCVKN